MEVGDQVRAGQVLAKLEPIDYRLAFEAAESELVAAKAAQERTQKDEARLRGLLQTQSISASEYEISKSAADSATAQVQRAERMLEMAQRRLAYCELIADSDSVVSQMFVDTGSVVAEGAPVFRLAQLGELEAVIDIPENRIELARTMQASVSTWAEEEQRFSAKLRETAPYADPNTRTYQTKFTILEPSHNLRLGMTAKVELEEAGQETNFRLPPSALVVRDGSTSVWIVDPKTNQLELRPIHVSSQGSDNVFVSSGIREGELVVRAGVHKLDSRMSVRIWKE